MEEKEISYVVLVLALMFFLVTLSGVKQRTNTQTVEVIKEVIVTATPTPTPTQTEAPVPVSLNKARPTPQTAPEDAQVIRVTCYLPTGNRTADGTIPYEGICAGAPWLIGMDALLYDINTGELYGRFEIRDTGGHWMLQNGTALDLFKTSYDRALAHVAEHGDWALVQYIPREVETDVALHQKAADIRADR